MALPTKSTANAQVRPRSPGGVQRPTPTQTQQRHNPDGVCWFWVVVIIDGRRAAASLQDLRLYRVLKSLRSHGLPSWL